MLSYKYEDGLKLEISTRNALNEDEERMYEKICSKYSIRFNNNFKNWHTLEAIEFETIIGKDKTEIETMIKDKIKESGLLDKFRDLVKNL